MKITGTPLAGAALVDLDRLVDDRGFFARTYCQDEFREAGLEPVVQQSNVAFNHRAGTMRGLHFQAAPHQEAKLVRCVRGAIYDVVVDLRPASPTYLRHFGVELNDDNRTALFVPADFAHGYLTLVDGAEVVYNMNVAYVPGVARGLRWDDPDLGVRWPGAVTTISERDATWALLAEGALG